MYRLCFGLPQPPIVEILSCQGSVWTSLPNTDQCDSRMSRLCSDLSFQTLSLRFSHINALFGSFFPTPIHEILKCTGSGWVFLPQSLPQVRLAIPKFRGQLLQQKCTITSASTSVGNTRFRIVIFCLDLFSRPDAPSERKKVAKQNGGLHGAHGCQAVMCDSSLALCGVRV